MGRFDFQDERDGDVSVSKDRRTRKPKKYKVLMHNDDYTTQDFVIDALMTHFHKNHAEATQIMLRIHHRGVGVCGVYSKDVAETKIREVTIEARAQGMPLVLSKEEE